MKIKQQLSVWFPDIETLEAIKKVAEDTNRGIGYVICEHWKKHSLKTNKEVK